MKTNLTNTLISYKIDCVKNKNYPSPKSIKKNKVHLIL